MVREESPDGGGRGVEEGRGGRGYPVVEEENPDGGGEGCGGWEGCERISSRGGREF